MRVLKPSIYSINKSITKKITFLDEYKRILDKLNVAYEDRYIFRLPEDE